MYLIKHNIFMESKGRFFMMYDNCDVYLECSLNAMPVISKGDFSETEIIISRQKQCTDAVEYYNVTVNWLDAVQILNYGYHGMSVMIYGVLRTRQQLEIVAEKISFIGRRNSGNKKVNSNGKHFFPRSNKSEN